MHLIPASSSHFHMLVSVFPSVGLIFALGFYITAMFTDNEPMKRVCLFVFGGLGILAIPTYFSGNMSGEVVSALPANSQDMIDVHYGWSLVALFMLVLLGVAGFLNLWKFPRGKKISENSLHLTLGLGLVTLLLMAIVGELGWEIAHHELFLPPVESGEGTPQYWSHIHIILNHFPTVGFTFGLFFFIAALVMDNDVMKRASLAVFTICGILGASTYVTGASAMWALTDPPIPGITMAMINAHRDWALMSLFGLGATGVTAWIEIWRYRHLGRFSKTSLRLVLIFAVITLALMAETGHRGGQIDHPEIRVAGDVVPTDAVTFWSPNIELIINNVIWFVPWQTVHFFGFTIVFAVVMAVVLRVLGFWKSLPFSAVHRLLPLGVFGVAMNVFTGMLMMMADTFRYVNEFAFHPKMIFLPIGAVAVLYFSFSDRLWKVKAGEEAPMQAKWVAVLVLLSWVIVIMGGRLLPYLFV